MLNNIKILILLLISLLNINSSVCSDDNNSDEELRIAKSILCNADSQFCNTTIQFGDTLDEGNPCKTFVREIIVIHEDHEQRFVLKKSSCYLKEIVILNKIKEGILTYNANATSDLPRFAAYKGHQGQYFVFEKAKGVELLEIICRYAEDNDKLNNVDRTLLEQAVNSIANLHWQTFSYDPQTKNFLFNSHNTLGLKAPHGDLYPSNIFIDDTGSVTLIDYLNNEEENMSEHMYKHEVFQLFFNLHNKDCHSFELSTLDKVLIKRTLKTMFATYKKFFSQQGFTLTPRFGTEQSTNFPHLNKITNFSITVSKIVSKVENA